MRTITLTDLPLDDGTPVTYPFTFPGDWNEADGDDLLSIARAIAHRKEPAAVKFDLLKDLARIPATLMHRMPPADHLSFEVDTTNRRGPYRPVETSEIRLLPQLDWAFTSPSYSKSLLPTIACKGLTWKGPDDSFETMTLHQWCFCTELLQAFRKCTDNNEALNTLHNLLGAMYQPEHSAWRSEPIEEYGRTLSVLAPEVKLAAVLNYEAIHSTLPNMYPRVFKPSVDGFDPSPQGLFSIAHDAAKSGAFTNYGGDDLVENKRLHLVLGYMEHTLYSDEIQAERAKRAAKETA